MHKPFFYLFCVLILLLVAKACNNNGSDSEHAFERRVIHTDQAPEAVGPYSQAVLAGNTLYLSGQVGLDPKTGELAGEDIETQARRALDNLRAVLEAANFSLEDVVQAQVYLTDVNDYGTFNEIYASYFENDPPARAVIEISRLPLDAKVEIMMTAVASPER